MAQRQDFHILGPVTHRQQAQQSQPVRHGQLRQSQQHSHASSRIGSHRYGRPRRVIPNRDGAVAARRWMMIIREGIEIGL
jgi:hypothetical protein